MAESKIDHISVGGVPYEIGGSLGPGMITAEMLGPDVVNGTTIVKNAQGQISLNGVDASDKILAASLSDDVWSKVGQIVDDGFGEVVNASY